MSQLYTNALITESSPYLLQHAHNPVGWHSWSDEVLEHAKCHDKLIVVSIGYSSCHWCHMMERETFNDEDVASTMNGHFISIKVDKEEHPEVNQQYMAAIRAMNKIGGWPLNMICLPDGRPVFGGTYFSKHQWIEILNRIQYLYIHSKAQLLKAVLSIDDCLKKIDIVDNRVPAIPYYPKYLRLILESWKRKFDSKWGGTTSTPKFPMPNSIDFLMSYAYHLQDETVKNHALLTLDKIYAGGIFDHIGGGFHRYAVDQKWLLPHFEKMLYDNALLSMTYASAYQLTKKGRYKRVAVETLEFILQELLSPEKLFYSSIDADSAKEDGSYYIWSYEEIKDILDDDTSIFCDRFGITANGNLNNHNNVLAINNTITNLSIKYGKPKNEIEKIISLSLKKLYCGRFLREKPATNTNILLGWNALAIKAFCSASTIFNDSRYLVVAIDAIKKIEEQYVGDDLIYRKKGVNGAYIKAVLEDYAFLMDAYLSLYTTTFNFDYLDKVEWLLNIVLDKFYDSNTGMFFFTTADCKLPLGRKMDLIDGVIPSSNSIIARVLYFLSISKKRIDYKEKANQMIANMFDQMPGAGPYIANWGMLLLNMTFPPVEITIVGNNAICERKQIDQEYLPNVFLNGTLKLSDQAIFKNRWKNGQTLIYLYVENTCREFKGTMLDLKNNAIEVRNCYTLQ